MDRGCDCTVRYAKKDCFPGDQGEGSEVKFYVDFMLWDHRSYAVDPHRIEAKVKVVGAWWRGSVDCC